MQPSPTGSDGESRIVDWPTRRPSDAGRPQESAENRVLAPYREFDTYPRSPGGTGAARQAPASARVSAACALLDRGWGRPPQHVDVDVDPPPAPGSYEALRRAVPASTTVYLPAPFDSSEALRVAAALSHARLLGAIGTGRLHLRTPWQTEPLGDHVPDLIITGAKFVPWVFPPASRQPIWWNDETAIYALDGAVEQIMPLRDEPFLFSVKLSDVRVAHGRVVFTATFDDRAPDQWSGQDWLLIATDNSPYRFPTPISPDGRIPPTTMWFTGQIWPGRGTASLTNEFDFLAPSLAVRRERGVLKPLDRSEAVLGSDSYVLAVRLRHEYKPGYWRDAAIIPVLRITVSETGEVSYQVHEDVGG